MKLLGKTWKYISEGNVHIVLQLEDTNYVLRLIKEDGKPVHKEHIKESLNFVNLVMVRLLKNYHYGVGEIVELPPNSLAELSRNLQQFRPKMRLNKTLISQFAIKTTNLAIVSSKCKSPAFCIEIKPKEGFISSSLRMHSRCYYCLKQYLKVYNEDVKQRSAYCPLDLFSGDRKRMKHSIECLLLNPQNNLKIFKDGIMLYHDKLREECNSILKLNTPFSCQSLLANFIVEVLLHETSIESDILIRESEMISSTITEESKVSCDESNHLKSECLLYNLLCLQKLSESYVLNNLDITEHPYDYVQQVLDRLEALKLDLRDQKDREIFLKTSSPIHLSLISSIAKDCSIMISFSMEYVEDMPYIDIQDTNKTITRLYFKMAVTDLEPKPITTLLKRKKTEQRIIDSYTKHLPSLNKIADCKIQPHSETRAKQLEAWETLIIDYLKATKQSTIDIRESQNTPLFNNADIDRKLSQEAVLTILDDMAKTGRAAPVDKSKNVWEIYWHSLEEWGNMVYNWACNNGMNNSVCTLFELREGDNTADEEFHGLDMNVLVKALKTLELKGRCELMEFEDSQGVKFF